MSISSIKKSLEYLYTKGKEFSINGIEYIGEYHIDSNMQPKTGPTRDNTGAQVLSKYYTNPEIYNYDKITKENVTMYGGVFDKVNLPTDKDYEKGEFNRYFVYKVNEPNPIFHEIDLLEFGVYGSEGGIDSVLYNVIIFPWIIKGDSEYVVNTNYSTAYGIATRNHIPGLVDAISNFAKYHK